MDGEHLDIQPRRGGYRLGNGVRNVVKLKVKEHRGTRRADAANNFRPGAGEEFAANFEGSDRRSNFLCQCDGFLRRGHIQRNNDWIRHGARLGKSRQPEKNYRAETERNLSNPPVPTRITDYVPEIASSNLHASSPLPHSRLG